MIRLYHQTIRNERTAVDQSAYMVDGDGFVEIPETDEGKRHVRVLVQFSDFMLEQKPENKTLPISAMKAEIAVEKSKKLEPDPGLKRRPAFDASDVSTDMSRADLRIMAGNMDVENHMIMSKAQLVAAIKKATSDKE
jgi:hypothetical protein